MNTNTCHICENVLIENSLFCHQCGGKVKCENCNSKIVKNAKFCITCGNNIGLQKNIESNTPLNTFKYHKTKDEISCEIAFTDKIGRESVDTFLTEVMGKFEKPQIGLADSNKMETHDVDYQNIEVPKNPSPSIANSNQDLNQDMTLELPHINDVGNHNQYVEGDWILIYAFYISKSGKEVFGLKDVRDLYLKNRKTVNRAKNFSGEWKKIFKNYFQTASENVFKIKSNKIEEITTLILSEKKQIKAIPSKKSVKTPEKSTVNKGSSKSNKTPAKSISKEEFDIFKGQNKKSLEDFLAEKNVGSNTNLKILVIGYYITKINKASNFTDGNIDYAFTALKLKDRPAHLRQVITNIKNRNLWIGGNDDKSWHLERLGEVYVEDKLPLVE